MRRGIKELLKPDGIYSMRRAIASVCCILLVLYTCMYLYRPEIYDENVIAVLCMATGVGEAAIAFKKYDSPNRPKPEDF
jgi:dolichol kinase